MRVQCVGMLFTMQQYKKATLDETVLSTVGKTHHLSLLNSCPPSLLLAKSTTLRECLQLFTEPETLPKDNAWYVCTVYSLLVIFVLLLLSQVLSTV